MGDSGNSVLRAYSDGAGDVNVSSVATNQWTNVWLTVDNDAKTYRVATSTGANDGSDSGRAYQFGRRTDEVVGGNPLTTFGIHEDRNVAVELDDLDAVAVREGDLVGGIGPEVEDPELHLGRGR